MAADTIPNPYTAVSPIGQALQNFGRALFNQPTEASRILEAEKALAARRVNENTRALADVFGQFGQPGFDRNRGMALSVNAGYDPKNLAELERYGSANTFGAADPRTTNAFVGAGGAFSSSPQGFAMELGEKQRQFNMKPTEVGGPQGNVIVPQQQSYGQPGPAGKTQPTPRNYLAPTGERRITYDGVTDANTRQPLPPGGAIVNAQGTPNDVGLRPTVQGKLQEQGVTYNRFDKLLAMTRDAAAKDPTNFGVTGFVKGVLQDVGQLGQNVAVGMGYNGINEALVDAQKRAAASGLHPSLLAGIYDPSLSQLYTLSDLLVFGAAEALASQQGRSVSDKDVQYFKSLVGDPRDWLMSQQKYLAKTDQIKSILDAYKGVNDEALRRPTTPGATAPAAPGVQPTPAAPGAQPSPAAPQVEVWGRRPDGTLGPLQ